MKHRFYTGYAKFFDASTNNCDSVTWKVWLGFKSQYLTQARRQRMNDLVDAMNAKVKEAVDRAGPQVVFIDYDPYVGYLNGRYCLPGSDESNKDKSLGANRDLLFFYEMSTQDTPIMAPGEDDWRSGLRRRDDNDASDGMITSDETDLKDFDE